MDRHNGETWAKLDAGTESYFERVDVTRMPFKRTLEDLLDAARLRGAAPDEREIEAYAIVCATSR